MNNTNETNEQNETPNIPSPILEWAEDFDGTDSKIYRAASFWSHDGDSFQYEISPFLYANQVHYKLTGDIEVCHALSEAYGDWPSVKEAKEACQKYETESFAEAQSEGLVVENP